MFYNTELFRIFVLSIRQKQLNNKKMKAFNEHQIKISKRSFCFGSFPKKYITGQIGDTFNVI